MAENAQKPAGLPLEEICRRLGPERFTEMFLLQPVDRMKQIVKEAGLSAARGTALSTRVRNERWARGVYEQLSALPSGSCRVMLANWLIKTRAPMLSAFCDALGVEHHAGVTRGDVLKDVEADRCCAAARELLAQPEGRFDRREMAAYLLALDAIYPPARLEPLHAELEGLLPPV